MNPGYLDILTALLPETALAAAAFLVLAVDALLLRGQSVEVRARTGAALAAAGCLAAWAGVVFQSPDPLLQPAVFTLTPLAQWVRQAILGLTLLTILLSTRSRFTPHAGEFFALVLLATTGLLLLAAAANLLLVFVALEMTSLCLYILTAFNKHNRDSAEAALKYFMVGGVSAAFLLYGLSLLYGLTHTLELGPMAASLASRPREPVFYIGLILTLMGFGFKIAVAPFHLWAPDTYQGAPLPVAALIASGSKVASFFVLANVLSLGFDGAEGSAGWRHLTPGYLPILASLSVASMLLGNLAALAQTSLRRLLAYSAVAHAGVMVLGLIAGDEPGLTALLYYAVTYALAVLGAFGVVSVVQDAGAGDSLSALAGLRQRAPMTAGCLLVFMLSLAGVPPLAGFFGKAQVFVAVLKSENGGMSLLWLVLLAIGLSVVSLYYYLLVLKQAFVADPPPGAPPLDIPLPARAALAVMALLVVILGCAPRLILDSLRAAMQPWSAGVF